MVNKEAASNWAKTFHAATNTMPPEKSLAYAHEEGQRFASNPKGLAGIREAVGVGEFEETRKLRFLVLALGDYAAHLPECGYTLDAKKPCDCLFIPIQERLAAEVKRIREL